MIKIKALPITNITNAITNPIEKLSSTFMRTLRPNSIHCSSRRLVIDLIPMNMISQPDCLLAYCFPRVKYDQKESCTSPTPTTSKQRKKNENNYWTGPKCLLHISYKNSNSPSENNPATDLASLIRFSPSFRMRSSLYLASSILLLFL